MNRVLDTSAVSALMKGTPKALERLRALGRDQVSVPQPVLAELSYGIARLPRSRRRSRLGARLDLLRGELRRAEWTDDVSEQFGLIKAALERRGERIEDFDVAIAAHALAVDAVLVTADHAHMPRIPGLELEDWAD